MIVLVLSWCAIANPVNCTEIPDRYQFDSGIACFVAAQQIAAQEPERPGYVLHWRCGPPEKEI